MRRPAAIVASALTAALLLTACGSDEAAPEPVAETATAAPTPPPTPTPEPTGPPMENVRVVIDEVSPYLLQIEGNACIPETGEGDTLYVVYETSFDNLPVRLDIPTVRGSYRDSACRIVFDMQAPKAASTGDLHLMVESPDGDEELAQGAYNSNWDGMDSILIFEITEDVRAAAGVTASSNTEEDAFLAAIAEADVYWGDDTARELERGYGLCEDIADRAPAEDQVWWLIEDRNDGTAERLVVEHLCPEHLDVMETAVRGFGDGVHSITSDPDYEEGEAGPGTYRTVYGARDCYWERATGGGDTIANDFVTAATEGVTITVYDGETFISERCGPWTLVD